MDKKGCIIVPYRDREEHLAQFIPHYRALVPELPIYVIEQADSKPFNRAKLLNVGFLEFGYKYDYAVYHDVDMLADNGDGYEWHEHPLHLATACSQFGYIMPYPGYFGGVVNIPTGVMRTVNGYSNDFYSWGIEDDHFRDRVSKHYEIWHMPYKKYRSLAHERVMDSTLYDKNYERYNLGLIPESDGLSSCVYTAGNPVGNSRYTHLTVEL